MSPAQKPPFPPGMFPPGVPMGAQPMPMPMQDTGPSMRARIVPRDIAQKSLYEASSVLAQAQAAVLDAIARLTDTYAAVQQTVEHTRTSDDLVSVGGVHLSAKQFAERYKLARMEDLDAVKEALDLLKQTAERMPIADMVGLSDLDD